MPCHPCLLLNLLLLLSVPQIRRDPLSSAGKAESFKRACASSTAAFAGGRVDRIHPIRPPGLGNQTMAHEQTNEIMQSKAAATTTRDANDDWARSGHCTCRCHETRAGRPQRIATVPADSATLGCSHPSSSAGECRRRTPHPEL